MASLGGPIYKVSWILTHSRIFPTVPFLSEPVLCITIAQGHFWLERAFTYNIEWFWGIEIVLKWNSINPLDFLFLSHVIYSPRTDGWCWEAKSSVYVMELPPVDPDPIARREGWLSVFHPDLNWLPFKIRDMKHASASVMTDIDRYGWDIAQPLFCCLKSKYFVV